jgi:hypothetical protein
MSRAVRCLPGPIYKTKEKVLVSEVVSQVLMFPRETNESLDDLDQFYATPR